jgi:hypothetical protein
MPSDCFELDFNPVQVNSLRSKNLAYQVRSYHLYFYKRLLNKLGQIPRPNLLVLIARSAEEVATMFLRPSKRETLAAFLQELLLLL